MRFLDIKSYEIKQFTRISKIEEALGQCAIISHRWGEFELSFQKYEKQMKEQVKEPNSYRDQFERPGKTSPASEAESEGFLKTARACLKACGESDRSEADLFGLPKDLKYIWMDTCCIDKQDSQEFQEAINSMFRWYSGAKVCYAYLPDVSMEEEGEHGYQACEIDKVTEKIIQPRIGSFESSDWFTRGWTLQELLAPTEMYFFDRYWRCLGSKKTLFTRIQETTNIDAQYLDGDISKACVATKMSWLARRETSVIEDMAYCMFGIFEINTYIRYSEKEVAFVRLQEEIIRQKPSDESIFAWKLRRKPSDESISAWKRREIVYGGLLAPWPSCFLGSENLTIDSWKSMRRKPYTVANGSIEFQAPNKLPENGNAQEWMAIAAAMRIHYTLKLNCWMPGRSTFNTISIPLRKKNGDWRRVNCDDWKYSWRPRSSRSIFGKKTRPIEIPQRVRGERDWGYALAKEQQEAKKTILENAVEQESHD